MENENLLTPEDKKTLLALARESIETYLKGEKSLPFQTEREILNKPGAAFVTLTRNKQLQGCIGHIVTTLPLYQCVREVAIAAASQDYRFSGIKLSELKEIRIEISYLTPLARVNDIREIEVGRDGLLIKKGYQQGLLLPQVADHEGWGREEFLAHTCLKAGLGPNAWKEGTEIYKFQAEIFSEGEFKN